MNKSPLSQLVDSLPWKFFRKLALMQILVTSLVIIATAYIARYYLKTYMTNQAHSQVRQSLNVVKESLVSQKLDPVKWCQDLKLQGRTRFTIIDWEGYILCDNGHIPKDASNISNVKEITQARETGRGITSRYDKSSATEMLFGATILTIEDEGQPKRYFLRQGFPLNHLNNAIEALDNSIIMFLFPLLLLTSLVSLWASLQVSFPLRSILKKVERMKSLSSQNMPIPSLKTTPSSSTQESGEDEWAMVEKTLDRAKVDIEKYLNELYNENAKITTLMESISDSILAVDQSGFILFANRHFKKNFLPQGLKEKDLPRHKLWEIMRDIDIQNLIRRCFEESTIVKQRSHPLSIKRGKDEAFFDITVSPLIDSSQKTFGVVCVFHDVTERIRADQMREDFVANVSHEVRTPLTALKGYVQILRNTLKRDPKEAEQYLETIESNSDRLTALFQDILNLSVIESQQKINKTLVNTEDITSGVISNIKQNHPEKEMDMEKDFDAKEVWGDPKLIEQVLTNLLDNTFKYSPDGGKVKVTWQQEKKGVSLEIHDSGEPIPAEHHPRIFERFYRIDDSRSREAGGTGLGLSIVKHIIQKHGGDIKLKTSDFGGNAFCAYFPAKKTPDQNNPSISYI